MDGAFITLGEAQNRVAKAKRGALQETARSSPPCV